MTVTCELFDPRVTIHLIGSSPCLIKPVFAHHVITPHPGCGRTDHRLEGWSCHHIIGPCNDETKRRMWLCVGEGTDLWPELTACSRCSGLWMVEMTVVVRKPVAWHARGNKQ